MKPAIIYMLEVLVCSGVLLAAYAILLERRVKFRWRSEEHTSELQSHA